MEGESSAEPTTTEPTTTEPTTTEPTTELTTTEPTTVATTEPTETTTLDEKKEIAALKSQSKTQSPAAKLKAVFSDKRVIIGLIVVVVLIFIIGLAAGLAGRSSSSSSSSSPPVLKLQTKNSGPVDLRSTSSANITFQANITSSSGGTLNNVKYYWNFSDGTQATSSNPTVTHMFTIDSSVLYINATVTVVTEHGTLNQTNSVNTYRLGNNTLILSRSGAIVTACDTDTVTLQVSNASQIPQNNSILVHNDTGVASCPFIIRKVVSINVISSSVVQLETSDADYADVFEDAVITIDTIPPNDQYSINYTESDNATTYPQILQRNGMTLQNRRKSLQEDSIELEGPYGLKLSVLADGKPEISWSIPAETPALTVTAKDFDLDFTPQFYEHHVITSHGIEYAEAWLGGVMSFSTTLDLAVLSTWEGKAKVFERTWCRIYCFALIADVPVFYQPFLKVLVGGKIELSTPVNIYSARVTFTKSVKYGGRYTPASGITFFESSEPAKITASPVTPILSDPTTSVPDCLISVDVYDKLQIGVEAYKLLEVAAEATIGIFHKDSYPATAKISDHEENALQTGCTGGTKQIVSMTQPYIDIGIEGKILALTRSKTLYSYSEPDDVVSCVAASNLVQTVLQYICKAPGPCVVATLYSDPDCQDPYLASATRLNSCSSGTLTTCNGNQYVQSYYSDFSCSTPSGLTPDTAQAGVCLNPNQAQSSNSYVCYDLCPDQWNGQY